MSKEKKFQSIKTFKNIVALFSGVSPAFERSSYLSKDGDGFIIIHALLVILIRDFISISFYLIVYQLDDESDQF
ncbi:hypothetical protein BpHYR1_027701 [Brachionus plicatilis]|uniref:Uncharacterized protein n=1 Tax=Brachionus plicatilis TaxID=10195 RepID=A0A3M7Q576_BRAPC|nr:hypothetical protein BpHYR1_027701 [Brachionus plicatilis]